MPVTQLQQVAVSTTHEVSDHDLVTSLFSVKNRLPRQRLTYHFRSIKKIAVQQFQEEVRQSELFEKPAATTDEFADQLARHSCSQHSQQTSPTAGSTENRAINTSDKRFTGGCQTVLKKPSAFVAVWSGGGKRRVTITTIRGLPQSMSCRQQRNRQCKMQFLQEADR